MTITLGWWAVPTAMTLALIAWGFMAPESAPTGYGSIGNGIVQAIYLLCGIIVCLIAWLIWALLA